jgi:aminopeptidase N
MVARVLFVICCLVSLSGLRVTVPPGGVSQGAASAAPVRGVSGPLARARAAAIRDVHYDLAFTIPEGRDRPVEGRLTLRFVLDAPQRVVLDFERPAAHLTSARTPRGALDVRFENGHIVVPSSETRAGVNEVTLAFAAGDEALNRNDEFLYTLFVPARARFAFPCFDQPDLKARYRLQLEVPAGWAAVANGAEVARAMGADGRVAVQFAETPPLPTYLFAFVAGRFAVEEATRDGRPIRFFHRETDAAKVARNRDAIVDQHAAALRWLEDYTGIPYPFGKFDIVLVPSFQFSGMEHPGAILYNASSLLLEEAATKAQQLDRASVIAHETAHMWFGDLVTMRWFDDVWMKEVFANFMAAKIVNPSFPELNHELRFLFAHYPAAYGVDRTDGTNPIRQPLANLADAGQLYGPIIYQKAPIVMRQLEQMLGDAVLRDGLREYLTRHAFGNADWPDLIALLDRRSAEDLAAWSRVWVELRGRPRFEVALTRDSLGKVATLALNMSDPLGRDVVWPQRLVVLLGGGSASRAVGVNVTAPRTIVAEAARLDAPRYVLPNGEGFGYGLFLLDEGSRVYLLGQIEAIPDALTRASAWVTLWDNMLEGRIAPAVLFDAATRALGAERDEQITERLLGYLVRTFWRYLNPGERASRSLPFEALLQGGLASAPSQTLRAAWFNALRDTALSQATLGRLERVWRRQERVPGLPLSEVDEITLAMELAVRDVPGSAAILDTQLARTSNPDRRDRLAFVAPALSADPATREAAFARFGDVANRAREPWVVEALRYLNHPLRARHALRFVRPGLELLRDIQQTGDIFFPTRWADALLSGHRTPEAAADVRAFLAAHPEYPERLRWTVLVTADELFRASSM